MLNSIAIALYGYLLAALRPARGQHGSQLRRSPRAASSTAGHPFSGEPATIWTLAVLALLARRRVLVRDQQDAFRLRPACDRHVADGGRRQRCQRQQDGRRRDVAFRRRRRPDLDAGVLRRRALDRPDVPEPASASPASRWRCSAATSRSASSSARCSSPSSTSSPTGSQFETDISTEIVQITQGVIVLSVVIAFEVVRRYRNRIEQQWRRRDAGRRQTIRRAGGGDGMSTAVQTPEPGTSESRKRRLPTFGGMTGYRWWLMITLLGLFVLSVIRVVTGADGLDSTGTLRAAVIATCPILMAGIGGLWSERAGVVNIGLEGQMILGTLGRRVLHLLVRPVAGHPRCRPHGRAARPPARDRDGHLRRRPHRLRCGDQHHRRRCRGVPRW